MGQEDQHSSSDLQGLTIPETWSPLSGAELDGGSQDVPFPPSQPPVGLHFEQRGLGVGNLGDPGFRELCHLAQ